TRARVLDSTPVFDAVATQDTVTQLRAAVRKVLAALGATGSPLAGRVRETLRRDDDYASPGKPPCDWDDPAAREALVDELGCDALAGLGAGGAGGPGRRGRRGGPAGPGRRPGCGAGGGRGGPDRPQDRARPGDLHRRHPGPARAQVPPPPVRRVQGAPVGGP